MAVSHSLSTTESQPPNTQGANIKIDAIVNPLRELWLPLESGDTIKIPTMTEDDFNLMLETLKLWKRRIVRSLSEKYSDHEEMK